MGRILVAVPVFGDCKPQLAQQLALELMLALHRAERAAFPADSASLKYREEQALFLAVMYAVGECIYKVGHLRQ
jgi:hypothetical protein